MKIRQDFVSNSSSCSFVIGDVKTIWGENTLVVDRADIIKMIDVIKQTFNENDNIPYDLDIKVRVYARNKNFAVLETALTGKTDYSDTFEDYRTHEIITKDPESFGFDTISVDLSRFINTVLTLDDKTCDMIEAITFDCDDYERSKCDMLAMLYDFFDHKGCNPNSEYSERNFRTRYEDSSFLKKLMS